jgi:predicted DCC family thiol-disulfide oxidoreductase YuxK
VLLYDRDCAFCRWSLDKVLAWDRPRRVRPVAIQSDEGQRLLAGLASERRLDSWHFVDARGVLFSAGDAAPPLARLLRWGGPLAAVLATCPACTERAYRFVARHRTRLTRLLRIDDNRAR